MKNANKIRALLFSSLGIVAVGVGFFAGSLKSYQGVYAASKKTNIKVNDGIVELGSYPQSIIKPDSEEFENIKSKGQKKEGVYTYNDEKYMYMDSVQYWSEGGGKYEDGSSLIADGQPAFFKFESIKWHVLYEDKDQDIYFLYAKYALDTMAWQTNFTEINDYNAYVGDDPSTPAYDWEKSTIREYLNNDFYNDSFTDKEKDYLKKFITKASESSSEKDVEDYASIISPSKFDEHKSSKKIKGGASDYAKSKRLSYHWHSYDSCFIWLNNYKTKSETKYVQYARGTNVGDGGFSESANITVNGMRPMIALDLSKVTVGTPASGESGSSGGGGSVNPALIIGIIFSIFGIGGLTAFMILWAKGKIGSKLGMKAIIAIVASAVVVTSVGFVCLASYTTTRVSGLNTVGGGGLGGCTFKYGYYLQSTAKYENASANFVQVGLSCYLFRSDGTVSYCAACEQEDASDFRGDSGSGSWTKSGCTLKFTYNTPMGSVNPTMTISGTKLLYNGREAYHWVRGE